MYCFVLIWYWNNYLDTASGSPRDLTLFPNQSRLNGPYAWEVTRLVGVGSDFCCSRQRYNRKLSFDTVG